MSSNKTLFVRSFKEEEEESDDDPWNDEALIKSYDIAVKQAKKIAAKSGVSQEESVKDEGKKNGKLIWNVGDYCKCPYSKDGLQYEAKIIQIFKGQNTCRVCFIGYENKEKVPLSKLRESDGEHARLLQIKDAEGESSDDGEEMEVASQSSHNAGETSSRQQARNTNSNINKNFNVFKSQRQNKMKFQNNGGPDLASFMPPMGGFPPPPPPGVFLQDEDSEVVSSMLLSWYMSGYHTGFYHGMKHAKQMKKL